MAQRDWSHCHEDRTDQDEFAVTPPIRILVVDDDDSMLLICRRFFTATPGYRVAEATSGEEAIQILDKEGFDCVLSDQRMGAVSGTDVLAFALDEQPQAVRVLMSGYADPRLIELARSHARIHEFIEKPMTTAEIEAVLQEAIVDRHFDTKARRVSRRSDGEDTS